MNLGCRTVNLRRPERARNAGSTGPESRQVALICRALSFAVKGVGFEVRVKERADVHQRARA